MCSNLTAVYTTAVYTMAVYTTAAYTSAAFVINVCRESSSPLHPTRARAFLFSCILHLVSCFEYVGQPGFY